MALFDKATYQYYTQELLGSVVPDELSFNRFKLKNIQYVKGLYNDGLLLEREENGMVSAVCMMIEEDYKASALETLEDAPLQSESIDGYSYQINTKAYEAHIEQNSKSLAAKKYEWLTAFCFITGGVR